MDGGFPSKATLNIADCSFGDTDSMVISVGANASENHGVATGRRDGTAVLPSLDRSEKTMANVGRFFNRKGEEILYRSILPPLSKNLTSADRIVLTFSHKIVH